MPCIFFCNWEDAKKGYHPAYINQPDIDKLIEAIAKAANISLSEPQLHFVEGRYWVWTYNSGCVSDQHGVHVFVEWHKGRGIVCKTKIAEAIHKFLTSQGLGKGSDIRFRDSPAGTFFYEGKLVPYAVDIKEFV